MATQVPTDHVDGDVLVRQSQAEREEATRLLDELRIVEQWQEYGDVEVAGSYRFDLMLGSDVDLYVVNPAVDLDVALNTFSRFVRRGEFLRFAFIDSVRGMPPWADAQSFPVGYYLGMARQFHNREWKVETWLLPSPPPRPDWIAEQMTDEARRTILRLKHERTTHHLAAPSFDIYRAVLLGHATTVTEMQDWLRMQKSGVRPDHV
jgi:hypothetical protein